jgi:hypothetical protein
VTRGTRGQVIVHHRVEMLLASPISERSSSSPLRALDGSLIHVGLAVGRRRCLDVGANRIHHQSFGIA